MEQNLCPLTEEEITWFMRLVLRINKLPLTDEEWCELYDCATQIALTAEQAVLKNNPSR